MLRNHHPVSLVVTSQLPNASKDSKPTVIMSVVGQRHPSRRIFSPPRTVSPLWILLVPAWVIQARYHVKHWCLLLDLACFSKGWLCWLPSKHGQRRSFCTFPGRRAYQILQLCQIVTILIARAQSPKTMLVIVSEDIRDIGLNGLLVVRTTTLASRVEILKTSFEHGLRLCE